MEHKQFGAIEHALTELKDDITVPKNVRSKMEKVIEVLNSNLETPIKVSKALNELEDIADDLNLQSYARAQIWNVVSILEKIK